MAEQSSYTSLLNGDNTTKQDLIREYHFAGYTYSEIILILFYRHHVSISCRQRHRILRSLGLRRQHAVTDEVVQAIQQDIQCSVSSLGYRSTTRRLLTRHGIVVASANWTRTVFVADRCTEGPSILIHVGGYDKLKRFGFAIHEIAKEDQLEIQTVEPVNAMEMEFPETDTVSTATELPQEMVDIMGENLVGAEPPECESVDDQDPPHLTEEEVNTPSDSQNIEVHRVDEVLADEITEIVEDLIQELPVVESNGDGTGGRRDSLEDYEDASDRLDPEGGAGRESGLEEDMVVSSDRGDNLTESSEKGDNLTESDVEMRDVEGEEVEKRDTEGESDTDNIRTQSDDHILSSTEQCAVDNRQLIDSSCVLDNKTDLDRLTVEGGAALEEMTVDI